MGKNGLYRFSYKLLRYAGYRLLCSYSSSFKMFKQVHDRVMPGTLNVSCTIPVVVEALIFITNH